MKTLKEHYEAIHEFIKQPILDEDGWDLDTDDKICMYEKQADFSNLENWEKEMLKAYIHYLCIMQDGWY